MNDVIQSIHNCTIGDKTIIRNYVNLYDCTIGHHSNIGTFVEIQSGVIVGNYVKIQSHTFICSGVTIEDEVFIGHGVMFVNDKYPQAVNKGWTMQKTIVKKGASLGSNCTILGGVIIGEGAVVGAGAVVTKDVPNNAIVVGNPAHIIRSIKS